MAGRNDAVLNVEAQTLSLDGVVIPLNALRAMVRPDEKKLYRLSRIGDTLHLLHYIDYTRTTTEHECW